MIDAVTFESLRPYLFSVAYRMLGSAAESEDVVRDAWLRSAAAPAGLASAKAWLTTVVTRLCLDRLKSARMRREEYVGPWLPEPVPTAAVETGEDLVARQESITLAFLVLLETLTPADVAVIEQAFGCSVVNQYSAWDVPQMAQSCPDEPALLHVNSERVVVRVVREDGADVAPGESGRIVVTVGER